MFWKQGHCSHPVSYLFCPNYYCPIQIAVVLMLKPKCSCANHQSTFQNVSVNFSTESLNANHRVQKRWRHKNFFLDFSVLDTIYGWSMMKNIHNPNWVGIGSWGPEIWLHEYLSSHIEISVNWPVPNSYEPGQFTLISMGLIRYSSSHISVYHEPIHVILGVWGFFIRFYWNIVMEMLKCKKENLMTSHFSTLLNAACA